MKRSRVLVMIAAYNEEASITEVTERLINEYPQYDYVIIDDGSTDATGKICDENGYNVLHLPVSLGIGGAIQTGYRYAEENGYDIAVQLDGDGQHDPAYIPEMAEKMEREGLDLVLASRFVTEKHTRTMRSFGNKLLNGAVKLATGKRITDSTSGMRLYGARLLRVLATDMNSSPEPDTLAYLLRSGAKYAECQVTMRERIAGESYLSPMKSAKYMMHRSMNILFVQWFRERCDLG